MTVEEAKEILGDCREYTDLNGEDQSAILDGDFTLEEIKAVVVLLEAKEDY